MLRQSVSIETVRKAIQDLIPGHPSLIRTAAAIGIPVRTLQRRLACSKFTYRELVDIVRKEKACESIKEGRALLFEIANQLGYADAASFTRAFERWTGLSPRSYRKIHGRRRSG